MPVSDCCVPEREYTGQLVPLLPVDTKHHMSMHTVLLLLAVLCPWNLENVATIAVYLMFHISGLFINSHFQSLRCFTNLQQRPHTVQSFSCKRAEKLIYLFCAVPSCSVVFSASCPRWFDHVRLYLSWGSPEARILGGKPFPSLWSEDLQESNMGRWSYSEQNIWPLWFIVVFYYFQWVERLFVISKKKIQQSWA